MKNHHYKILYVMLFFACNHMVAQLNDFGISTAIPSHANDNATFDLRISQEMAHGKPLQFHGRHTTSFTINDILAFIPKIKAHFQDYLNHPDKQNPNDIKLAKLAIIDVLKAKKMLQPQDVTNDQEHQLRYLFDPIKVKINGYLHSDAIEDSAYLA